MSGTFKDKPWKYKYPEKQWDYQYEDGIDCWFARKQRPGVLSKKKRNSKDYYHGMSTPMWWVREVMNRPQRCKAKAWEHTVVKCSVDELDAIDTPIASKKPHIYYW